MSGNTDTLLSDAAHRRFWRADKQFEKFQSAATQIVAAIDLEFADLARQVQLSHGGHTLSAKTFRRYLNTDPRRRTTRPQHYAPVTALCTVIHDLCRERAGLLTECSEAVATIAWLTAALGEEFAGSKLEEPKPLQFLPPARQVSVNPAKLRRLLSVLPSVRTNDDPDRPIFPLNSPRYPATPSVELTGQAYRLFIKDESFNVTGSHKDRWALEKLIQYKEIVRKQLEAYETRGIPIRLPSWSMISSGSAAFALQYLFRLYGLPPIRVIMDRGRTDDCVVDKLRAIGAVVRLHDLEDDFLTPDDVKSLTHNEHGEDITTRDVATPHQEFFYDWLICEILKVHRPTHIFLPLGTGDLFASLLEVLHHENTGRRRDVRLGGLSREELRGIHILAATTNNPQTTMDKLYAPFHPTRDGIKEKLARLLADESIGDKSGVYLVDEQPADDAFVELRKRNFRTEHSGAAGLALLRMKEADLGLTASHRVVVVNTGWLKIGQ